MQPVVEIVLYIWLERLREHCFDAAGDFSVFSGDCMFH